MTKTTLSRRHLLAGASATAAASFVASARPAAAKTPLLKSQAPAFYRFNVKVGDVALECTSCGSGIPVVLLANAGCSVGYFDYLAGTLATRGLQAVSINMRGVAGGRGSLDGTTLHDLAGDERHRGNRLWSSAPGRTCLRQPDRPVPRSRSATIGSQRDPACGRRSYRTSDTGQYALSQCEAVQDEQ